MTFGIGIRNRTTGAQASVEVLQIASVLPALYVFAASGYRGLFLQEGLFSRLFALGVSVLPRVEAVAMSFLYRKTSSEMIFYFALLAVALAVGLVTRRLFGEETGVIARKVYAGLIIADLVIRLLPLPCNGAFGLPMAAIGFAVRLACLVLVLLDLRACRRGSGAQK